MRSRRTSAWLAAWAIGLAALSGCAGSPDRLVARMRSEEPLDRIQAIVDGSRVQEPAVLRAIAARLDDEDPAVRLYAILALEKLTGTRLGYDYWAPARERELGVQRWQAYIDERFSTG